MSLVEATIRRRADEVGRWTPSSLPAGASMWVPFLLHREWRSEMNLCTVAAGLNRSFFVDAKGALLACGAEEKGERGRLGLRIGSSQTSIMAVVPISVPSMAGVRVRAVVSSYDCNLAVSEAGQFFAWGHLSPREQTDWREWHALEPTPVVALQQHRMCQVVAGTYHCAVLSEDGSLFTWATVSDTEPVPELGHGSFVLPSRAPYRVFVFEGVRIVTVAVGDQFTAAVTEAGSVYSFGRGDGRLGHGDGNEEVDVFLPKRIEALDGIYVATVAVGDYHALALTRCGRVYSWGADGQVDPGLGRGNDRHEGGDGNDGEEFDCCIPQVITALLGKYVRAIAACLHMSCAVTDAGALYTWGLHGSANLGHGNALERPVLVAALDDIRVVGVSLFTTHALSLAADGSVYSFGEGPGLGIRQEGEQATRSPQRIPDLVCMVPR
jgi:alpha-tubulin suppressor-like RCC1 family protein